MSAATEQTVSIADIEAAAERLAGLSVRTPLLEHPILNRLCGGRILMKAETLQNTGSFKFRGAYNRISTLPPGVLAKGILAWSSGNHAQGVAMTARLVGTKATIVMPSDAPSQKIENTRAEGADVLLYDRATESREAIGTSLATERELFIVRPYDDPLIIAGQGTVGLEIDEQCQEMGLNLDAVLTCCSGGGLSAGCAIAIADRSPSTEIYTVEPEGFDDTARSLASGTRQSNAPGGLSICDALLVATPGELTFPILQDLASGGVSVSEEAVRETMHFAFSTLKLVLEPGGAAALAAVLSKRFNAEGKTVAVTLSGGNISPEEFQEIINV